MVLRRLMIIVAMMVLLATAIEYGLITASPTVSVAEGTGPIIN